MRRWVGFVLALALVGGGLPLSVGLGTIQLWLFGGGVIGLVGIATESFLQLAPGSEQASHRQVFRLWIAPGLMVAAGLWLVQVTAEDSRVVVAETLAALMGILLLGLLASLETGSRFYRSGRFAANLLLYLSVFLLFALIYHTRERSLITATSIGLVALLAALELLRSDQGQQASGWPMAALVALIVAETTWALNYWPVSGLVGGAMLLLTLYVFAGLLLAAREGGLDRRMLLEYGTVGIVGLAAITWATV